MRADVLVIGAGPAGLAAASELKQRGIATVLVADGDEALGGSPRFAGRRGYGVKGSTGAAYSARLADDAKSSGAVFELGTPLVLQAGLPLRAAAPDGQVIEADAVIVATGCSERPAHERAARGSGRSGVLTSTELLRIGEDPDSVVGKRAVVVGGERASFAAVGLLTARKASVAALVAESLAIPKPVAMLALALRRAQLRAGFEVQELYGRDRVQGVRILNLKDRSTSRIACDTVVFSGDWLPNARALRRSGAVIDPGTKGPVVDVHMRTSVEGLLAAGDVVHPGGSAHLAVHGGTMAAAAAADYLSQRKWPQDGSLVKLVCEPPLAWVTPCLFKPDRHEVQRPFLLSSGEARGRAVLEVCQGGHLLYRIRRLVIPGRFITLPPVWIGSASSSADEVRVSVKG